MRFRTGGVDRVNIWKQRTENRGQGRIWGETQEKSQDREGAGWLCRVESSTLVQLYKVKPGQWGPALVLICSNVQVNLHSRKLVPNRRLLPFNRPLNRRSTDGYPRIPRSGCMGWETIDGNKVWHLLDRMERKSPEPGLSTQGFACWTNDIYMISINHARMWTCYGACQNAGGRWTILNSPNVPSTTYIYVKGGIKYSRAVSNIVLT